MRAITRKHLSSKPRALLAAAGLLIFLGLAIRSLSLSAHVDLKELRSSGNSGKPRSFRASKLSVLSVEPPPKSNEDEYWQNCRDEVRDVAKATWAVYEKYAMGSDELAPLSLQGKSNFGNMAATLVDSLDTLWLFGLHDEFKRARNWLERNWEMQGPLRISLFETTIRIIGGLIAAFDLTADDLFLQKAKVVADRLMPAFQVNPLGIPINWIFLDWTVEDFQQNAVESRTFALAEFGSIQLEYVALSHRLGNPLYGNMTEHLLHTLDRLHPETGLQPIWFDLQLQHFSQPLLTVGAMADSYYEYLLKLWLLHGKKKELYRAMWERATDDALVKLLGRSLSGLTYLGQRAGEGSLSANMEHLACYFPGNVALGVLEGAVNGSKATEYLHQAEQLTLTCWQMYNQTNTGLAPDITDYDIEGRTGMAAIARHSTGNLLRPETVESFFYLWRATGDGKYRDWGWAMFKAFQQHSRTPEGAYASISDVNTIPAEQLDTMESFWISETLKYLWLLFSDDSVLSLSDMVLNTEAHPLKILRQDQTYT